MNLRNILKYMLLSVVALTTVVGCTNLDEKPFTFIDPKAFYKNENQLEDGLASVYAQFRKMNADYKYIMRIECCTDYGQPSYTKDDCQYINSWYDINNASTHTFTNVWKNSYIVINRANTVIARGQNTPMDETKKEILFAQARFLRAYSYYVLVRIYGGVPISTKFTEGVSKDLDIPRVSVSEVYDYIIAELEHCEEVLPMRGEEGYEVWRSSKGAVQTLLGSVYLTMASMEDNMDYYQKSLDYNAAVIASGKYQLMDKFTDLWYAFNPNAKNNEESIFELQFTASPGQFNNNHTMFGLGNSITIPGMGFAFYHRYGPSIYAWESYDKKDERLGAFITSFMMNDKEHKFLPSDKGYYPGQENWLTATPGNAKYYDFQTSVDLALPCANFYMLRYAEVLLNYAEAKNKLEGGSQDALDKLNEVRRRSKLDDLVGLNQQDLDEAIFLERGWEFIGEAKIYYDELRTNRLGKRLKAFVDKGVSDGLYLFLPLNFIPTKDFLWMIPEVDLKSNDALVQNPKNISDAL